MITFNEARIGDGLYLREGETPESHGCLYIGDAKYIVKTGKNSYDGYSADGEMLGNCSGCLSQEHIKFGLVAIEEPKDGDHVRVTAWDGWSGASGDPIGKTGYIHKGSIWGEPKGEGDYLCLKDGANKAVLVREESENNDEGDIVIENKLGEEKMTNEETKRPVYIIITRNTETFKKGGVFRDYGSFYSEQVDAFIVKPYEGTYIRPEQVDVLLQKKVAVEAVEFNPKFVTLEQNEVLGKALDGMNKKKPSPKKPVAKKTTTTKKA